MTTAFEQIIDGIVVGQMAIDPRAVTVTVEEGIVALSGKLERRLLVQDLLDEVRAIDGVVAVHSTVGYDVDDTPMPYRPPVLTASPRESVSHERMLVANCAWLNCAWS